jgi:hypothetical protein
MYKQALIFAKLKAIGEDDEKRLTLDIPYPENRLGELGLDFAVNDKSYHSEGGGSIPYDASLDGVEVVARITFPTEYLEDVKKMKDYQTDSADLSKVDKVRYAQFFSFKKGDQIVCKEDGSIENYNGLDKDEPMKFPNL